MSLLDLFIIAIGVSMDAFAVAICKGLCFTKPSFKKSTIVGLYFGIFQGMMTLIGYILGKQFQEQIVAIDHWIAFILLGAIGINMIKESRKSACATSEEVSACGNASLDFKRMLILSIATSIDALAIGITLGFLKVNIIPSVLFIGIITFIFSFTGVNIGSVFGAKYKAKAEALGGIILIGMGFNILLEHLELIPF